MKTNIEKMRQEAKSIPTETYHANFNQLMCAVVHEAMVDYVGLTTPSDKQGLPAYLFNKPIIMKDLLKQDMVSLSNGASVMAAKALKDNAKQVKKNIQNMHKYYELIKVETYDTPQYR
jgi:hypothetical protein